jgi:hypothetical protein
MSNYKPLDSRQIVSRALLQELFPYVPGQTLDVLMSSINQDLTVPLNVTATNAPSLTVNVGPSVVANSVSNRNKSLTFVNGVIPEITSATVTFPSTSGGNITTSTGASIPLTLPSGSFVQVLLTIDDLSHISATVGSPNVVEANLIVPSPANNLLPFAYVTLFNSGGTIIPVTQANIFQIVGPEATTPSSSGSTAAYIAKNAPLSQGATELVVNLTTPMNDLSYVVLAMMGNTIDPHPQYQQVEVTSKTLSSFTFQFNAPTDTANYFISYIVPPLSAPGTEVSIGNADTSINAFFSIPKNGTSYGIVGVMQDLVDPNPQFQTPLVTNQTAAFFVDTWNAPTSSAHYQLVYISNPTGQTTVSNGAFSASVTFPVAYGSPTAYAIVASLSNLTDAFPLFQPIIITGKTGSAATFGWNVAMPTGLYVLTYYALSVTT